MKVVVALSGGPESLVTAWLLKKQGMQVRGIHFDVLGKEWVTEKMLELERKLGIGIQVVPCADSAKALLENERRDALDDGRLFFPKQSFHQHFLFPKLVEFQEKYSFDHIATGHRVGLQEDPVAQVSRVVQGAAPEKEESELLLGVPQTALRKLICPLGSIPSNMLEKLIAELDSAALTTPFEFDWEAYMKAIPVGPEVGMPATFYVMTTQGMRINVAGTHQDFSLGAQFMERDDLSKVYRVIEVLPKERKVVAQIASEVSCTEFDLDLGHWFGRPDLKLATLDCGVIWEGRKKPVQIRIMQYQGNRFRGVLTTPLKGDEVNIFKGKTVLFMNGPEVLGGARVFQVR